MRLETSDVVGGTQAQVTRRRFLRGSATMAVAAAGATMVPSSVAAADDWRSRSSAWVDVDRGVRLRVTDWGSGKPIVMVHGWPSSHRIFERQLLGLASRGYRAIGIDLRGFGESDTPWDGNDYDTWARDLGAVIGSLGLRDVTLVGYSMGGAISAHYLATARHSRVRRLVLVAAALPRLIWSEDNPNGMPLEMFEGMLQGILADRSGFFAAFTPSMFHRPVSDAYAGWFNTIVTSGSLRATIRGLEEARDRDLREELTGIDVATTIIHGVHDQVVPFAFAEQQQRLIVGSTLVPFEDSGHGLFADEADRLTNELARIAG